MDKEYFLNLLGESYFGNTVESYLIALAILLGIMIFLKLLKGRIFARLEKWAHKTKTDLDDEFIRAIETIPGILYFFVALYVALQILILHPVIHKTVEIILVILVIYWATKLAAELIEFGLAKVAKKQNGKREKNTTYYALNLISKLILWSTGLLLILSNLGVNISALVASLGIGGIAVALAIQNILSDIFSSFSLYLDKPFEIGDFIIVGENMGTVKKIGLKTTRIEALQGEEIVISNNELTSTRVRNFKKMKKRRIVFLIGVTYSTPHKLLSKIPKIIKETIKSIKKTTFDRSHFANFGASSLNFETVYYLESSDYNEYMDTQQKINLALVKSFEKEGIEIAFPTQTVYLHQAKE
ncbi:mechanosensitive ion channel [Candidatus Peregrinibacteria bacterium]|nr:mechanosensitive ion channel [Candidatus Peregrinibacteria bacterium]